MHAPGRSEPLQAEPTAAGTHLDLDLEHEPQQLGPARNELECAEAVGAGVGAVAPIGDEFDLGAA